MKRARGTAKGGSPWLDYLDRRPIVLAIDGPNGSGKTTFFEAHLKSSGWRFLNADAMAKELDAEAYAAARMIAALRTELVNQRESFIVETVFSDPVGDKLGVLKRSARSRHFHHWSGPTDKLGVLKRSARSGFAVVLCCVGISSADTSDQRVAMRVSQGGHDVPREK